VQRDGFIDGLPQKAIALLQWHPAKGVLGADISPEVAQSMMNSGSACGSVETEDEVVELLCLQSKLGKGTESTRGLQLQDSRAAFDVCARQSG